jgi:hypothetical protein
MRVSSLTEGFGAGFAEYRAGRAAITAPTFSANTKI